MLCMFASSCPSMPLPASSYPYMSLIAPTCIFLSLPDFPYLPLSNLRYPLTYTYLTLHMPIPALTGPFCPNPKMKVKITVILDKWSPFQPHNAFVGFNSVVVVRVHHPFEDDLEEGDRSQGLRQDRHAEGSRQRQICVAARVADAKGTLKDK